MKTYQKLKRSRWTGSCTHKNKIEIFQWTLPSFSIRREQMDVNTRQRWHFVPSLETMASSNAIFVMCSHTFALFWLRKMAVSIKIFRVCFRVPVLQWSLQFLIRVFTLLSLILWYSYFGTFLSTWSIYIYIYSYMHYKVHIYFEGHSAGWKLLHFIYFHRYLQTTAMKEINKLKLTTWIHFQG